MLYCFTVLVFSLVMTYSVAPRYGRSNPLVYISICSLVGSVSVMAIKGFGIALKLTFSGNNQLGHPSTYVFGLVTAGCILVQMNYFNKALDTFSTNVYVLPVTINHVLFLIYRAQRESHVLRRLLNSHNRSLRDSIPRFQHHRHHQLYIPPCRFCHHFPWCASTRDFPQALRNARCQWTLSSRRRTYEPTTQYLRPHVDRRLEWRGQYKHRGHNSHIRPRAPWFWSSQHDALQCVGRRRWH